MNGTILIADDMEINREILVNDLASEFEENYQLLQAEDGLQVLEIINSEEKISAVLLDLGMPKMGGMEVLQEMSKSGKINYIPVFVVTAEENQSILKEAYKLGAVDVIKKPYVREFLQARVGNIIELYQHRNHLEELVSEQVERLKAVNQSMIETLATLVEFRDCESGEHVKRMCKLTDILMTKVSEMYPEYYLPRVEIDKIVSAAILHDVGKIAIPDSILNKPGRLADEEFATMKLHTVKGCEILTSIPEVMDKDIYDYSYDICRHHHERWDGRGYPDRLAGDEISIWAQVVALADVYDALTSPRCYKKEFDHETAVKMILNNECGVFNPKILKAFMEAEDQVKEYNAAN